MRTCKKIVDERLDVGGKLVLAVPRRAAVPMFKLRLDAVVAGLESGQHFENRLTVGREIGGAVVGDHRHLVLRQQPAFDERDQRVEAPGGSLQAPAAQHDEEHAMVLRRTLGFGGRSEGRPPPDAHWRCLELEPRELTDHLRDAVFEYGEVVRLQVRDGSAAFVEHPHVERDHGDVRAERAGHPRLRALCQRGSGKQPPSIELGAGSGEEQCDGEAGPMSHWLAMIPRGNGRADERSPLAVPRSKLITTALRRGLRKRCPHCGKGPLFSGWAQNQRCTICGLVFVPNPGDTWAFTIFGDRLPIGGMIVLVYFGAVRAHPVLGLTLMVLMLAVLIWTAPNRWGVGIALHYLSRVYWPDPTDLLPPPHRCPPA